MRNTLKINLVKQNTGDKEEDDGEEVGADWQVLCVVMEHTLQDIRFNILFFLRVVIPALRLQFSLFFPPISRVRRQEVIEERFQGFSIR